MCCSWPGSPPDRQPRWVTVSATAIRCLPFGRYRAANALARFSRRPFLSALPPELGGASFVCDLSDSIAREVCFTGRYEPQETQLAVHLLEPGMQVIDAGANWGYFSLVAAHLVGPTGRVLALEPHPALHAALSANVRRNGLTQVSCLRLGAADVEGAAGFCAFAQHGGNSGLSRLASSGERVDFQSPVQTIDAVADRAALDAVHLVKIDVEGAELQVLRGMADGLGRRRYRVVLLECHPGTAGPGGSVDVCARLLLDHGYRGWHIDHTPGMHRRAAAGAQPPAAMLAPYHPAAEPPARWPHQLWLAPGQEVPA
ncbi:MAG TPA: FkbM family methyltransferase [Vicinamibacterales bacterium]|nr:FkbM family methyltransferase [Vicinamibacterales bacterium]